MSADPRGISPLIAPCILHTSHGPKPWLNDLHHVILESWTVHLHLPQSRKVSLCPTGHVNLHVALRNRIAGRPNDYHVSPALRALVDEAMTFYTEHQADLTGQPA